MCHSHIRLLTLQEETGSERGREVGGWGMGRCTREEREVGEERRQELALPIS